jgi:hypothetical protein
VGGRSSRKARAAPLATGATVATIAAVLAALALAAARTAAAAPPPAPPAPSLEYDVKAAFLYNFAKFVEWPVEARGGERDPLTLCIFGADPFGSRLVELVKGETVAGRTLAVRNVRQLSELRSCHIAFFSRAEEERVPEALSGLHGSNVLTVGEGDDFAEQGGIVQFYLEENRVRFAINLDALEGTRLRVSSKLLRLARVVHPAARGGGR